MSDGHAVILLCLVLICFLVAMLIGCMVAITALLDEVKKQREIANHHYNLFARREMGLVKIQKLAERALEATANLEEIRAVAAARWDNETDFVL